MSILENARQHYLAEQKAPRVRVEVPEWNAVIFIKKLNLAEASEIEQARAKSIKDGIVKSVALRCVDESGNRLFFSHHEKILAEEVSPAILSRIVMKMAEPTTEELEKN